MTIAEGMLVAVTVALEMLVEMLDEILVEAVVIAACEDAAASSCWGGRARNVSFVGLLQVVGVPQQAHRLVLEL